MPLETKDLKQMALEELEGIANTLATRLLALDTINKQDSEEYKRVAGELFHVAAIIEEKEQTN